MSLIVQCKLNIRRALEGRLKDICDAQSPAIPVHWNGTSFEKSGKPVWVGNSLEFGDVIVTEIGRTPRFKGNGGFTIYVSTPSGEGQDYNDQVAGIIAAGYPYGDILTYQGVDLIIDKANPGAYGGDAAWVVGMFTIDWNIYRRP